MSDAEEARPASIRGEVDLLVCGRQVRIAPTFPAIDSIEARLRCGLPELLQRSARGDVRIRDLAIMVQEGLRGAGYRGQDGEGDLVSFHQIGEDVLRNFGHYAVKVGEFLGNALGGPVEKKDLPPSGASALSPKGRSKSR